MHWGTLDACEPLENVLAGGVSLRPLNIEFRGVCRERKEKADTTW